MSTVNVLDEAEEVTTISAPPTSTDAREAQNTSEALRVIMNASEPVDIELRGKDGQSTMRVPIPAARLLIIILDEMSRGRQVSVVPVHAELTTQEAADILNISRPSLIEILESGQIAFTRVKKHRRIRAEDVLAFKRRLDRDRSAALEELVALDQELGLS